MIGVAVNEFSFPLPAPRRFCAGTEAGEGHDVEVAGVPFVALSGGALWHEDERLLVVADLHLEKGSSFARRGSLLPPYDTAATLASLAALIFRHDPSTVIALGDSFHDNDGAYRMSSYDAAALRALQRGRDWVWIAGNHDDDLPEMLGGQRLAELTWNGIAFRHEPTVGGTHEVSGHLHPAARVYGPRGRMRRRCFVGDGNRLILPALGAYAGGLNVLGPAFKGLFHDPITAFVLGARKVYAVTGARLCAD